jgi:hypothetical protein
MYRLRIYIAPVVLVLLSAGYFISRQDKTVLSIDSKHRGVCWVGQPEIAGVTEIEAIKSSGVNWISQTPFGWQRHAADTMVAGETSSQTPWWGESLAGIVATTRIAKDHGVKTLLKPHLWVRNSWPGEIEMQSEQDWKAWFRNYEKFILSYARLADSVGISVLCIGTELHKTIHRPEWRPLIGKIRAHYSGEITYAANFDNEFEEVEFWDELDYIGVQAYFPLSKNPNPNVPELRQGWKEPIKRIRKVHESFKTPVIFTELGYRSTPDAAIEPWRWPQKDEVVSFAAQSNCYEAFFQTVWQEPWIAGVYFWKWYPHTPRRTMQSDFTPQGKPALEVMSKWFESDSMKSTND